MSSYGIHSHEFAIIKRQSVATSPDIEMEKCQVSLRAVSSELLSILKGTSWMYADCNRNTNTQNKMDLLITHHDHYSSIFIF